MSKEFTEIQDPDDPDLQQTDPFLEEYLNQIDEQGEAFYGEDDTKFMAGDQGGPGSELGKSKSSYKGEKVGQPIPQMPRQMGTLGDLGMLLQQGIMYPVLDEEEEEELTMAKSPYDFSSIYRSPEQEAKYLSKRPISSTNDELLKLIKGGS